MNKVLLLALLFLFNLSSFAQNSMRTQIFDPNVKTLQIGVGGENFSLPVIELNGNSTLNISFDELSHEGHWYGYRVLHCNADWTLSSIMSTEYLSGFTTGNISDYVLSVNTTMLYTNYRFTLPNNEMQFRLSGNYVVQIYENNDMDNPVAQACFSVVEPHVKVSGKVRGNTDTELNRSKQQLDFEVDLSGYQVREPRNEIKVTVRQNERLDNQVTNILPTYHSSSKLSYINNRDLIFEGGNEYHRFDISSVYSASYGLDVVHYNSPYYDAFLIPYGKQTTYSYEPDVNGKFLINLQESFTDIDTEADYIRVHFTFDSKEPFFDGQIYVGGGFNYNLMDDASRMKYDMTEGKYILSYLLKQGGYNYQYWFLPKGQSKATLSRTDGSFWQTNNEYTIYVYHRGWGERYDRLVGVEVITN